MLKDVPHPKYKPGQVWKYDTRPGEADSRLTVLKVESHPKMGFLVHVRLDGLRLKNPAAPGGTSGVAGHLPFDEKAIDRSVTSLESQGEVPDFRDGYDTWRKAFDQGKAGAFSIPVKDAVEGMAQALRNAKPE